MEGTLELSLCFLNGESFFGRGKREAKFLSKEKLFGLFVHNVKLGNECE